MLATHQKLISQWAVVFLTTVGTGLLILIFSRFADVTTLAFSWVLHFLLMFWISVVEMQFQLTLNAAYFEEQAFEQEGRIYEKLGVQGFRKLLVLSGWEKLNRKKNPISKKQAALLQAERATRVSEFGHLVIAVLVLLITVVVIFQYSVLEASWLILLNILFNVYPIMVQRYNRPRLHRAIQRFKLLAK